MSRPYIKHLETSFGGCGGRIAWLKKIPENGDIASAKNVEQEHFTPMEGDVMRCDSCGKPVSYGAIIPMSAICKE